MSCLESFHAIDKTAVKLSGTLEIEQLTKCSPWQSDPFKSFSLIFSISWTRFVLSGEIENLKSNFYAQCVHITSFFFSRWETMKI